MRCSNICLWSFMVCVCLFCCYANFITHAAECDGTPACSVTHWISIGGTYKCRLANQTNKQGVCKTTEGCNHSCSPGSAPSDGSACDCVPNN
jgi:hypothetical protein